ILFADEYHKNRVNAKKHLSRFGSHVDIAQNCEEVQSYLHHSHYELIFLATNIPGCDAYELVRKYRDEEKENQIPAYIIGMAPSNMEVENRRWLQAGMSMCIAKPYSFSKVEEIIRHYAQEYKEE